MCTINIGIDFIHETSCFLIDQADMHLSLKRPPDSDSHAMGSRERQVTSRTNRIRKDT